MIPIRFLSTCWWLGASSTETEWESWDGVSVLSAQIILLRIIRIGFRLQPQGKADSTIPEATGLQMTQLGQACADFSAAARTASLLSTGKRFLRYLVRIACGFLYCWNTRMSTLAVWRCAKVDIR